MTFGGRAHLRLRKNLFTAENAEGAEKKQGREERLYSSIFLVGPREA